jgi:hypothetical protein
MVHRQVAQTHCADQREHQNCNYERPLHETLRVANSGGIIGSGAPFWYLIGYFVSKKLTPLPLAPAGTLAPPLSPESF